jgi:hypothetical protein
MRRVPHEKSDQAVVNAAPAATLTGRRGGAPVRSSPSYVKFRAAAGQSKRH